MPTAEERIATLETENAALRTQVQELLTQNQELQARLANATKDTYTTKTHLVWGGVYSVDREGHRE